jgi:YidC/Oxa1 family membrane protein insertase
MFSIIARALAWYYSIWPSYGMAIVFLTLTVMVLVLPLTLKATRSMLMMQALQPEIKKLQAEHRDDRQKLNEEMLALYRQNKINPMSGCLPLLIQFPIFIVLYQVLRGLTYIPPGGDGFEPKYIDHSTALYQALEGQTTMMSWGLDLSKSATQVASDNFVAAIPYLLLILAVAGTTYVQQKQISARNPNSDTLANPQQKLLLRIMPAFMAFISLSLPAALVVYFFVSNLFRVGQQALISHAIYKPAVREGLVPPRDKGDKGDKGDKTSGDDQPRPAKPGSTGKGGRGGTARPIDTTSRPAKSGGDGAAGKARPASARSAGRADQGRASGRAKPASGSGSGSGAAGRGGAARAPSGRAQPPKSSASRPAGSRSPSPSPPPEPAPKPGFLSRLMGGSGDGAGGNGVTPPAKPGSGGTGGGAPRSASGRVTPAGGDRKKKRK